MSATTPTKYQFTSWRIDDDTSFIDPKPELGRATIRLTARGQDGTSVFLSLTDYHPYFYLDINLDARPEMEVYHQVILYIRGIMSFAAEGSEHEDTKWINYGDHLLWEEDPFRNITSAGEFNNNRPICVVKLSFRTCWAYRKVLSELKRKPEKVIRSNKPRQVRWDFYRNAPDYIQPLLQKDAIYDFPAESYQLYDCIVDPLVKFLITSGHTATGWMDLPPWAATVDDEGVPLNYSSLQLEYRTSIDDIVPLQKVDICPQLVVLTFDFEVYSKRDGVFPLPEVAENEIFQIGVTVRRVGQTTKEATKWLLHIKKSQPPPSSEDDQTASVATYREYKNERDLLAAFSQLITDEDPDIITGHNIDGFDWNYFFVRAAFRGCRPETFEFSRIHQYCCTVRPDEFVSAQKGASSRMILDCPGRLNMDLMTWMNATNSAGGYSNLRLQTIAEKELGQGKGQTAEGQMMTAAHIFAAYRKEDPQLLGQVAAYCIQDVVLVDQLVDKLDCVSQTYAAASISNVPLEYLFEKGQMVRVASGMAAEGYEINKLMPWRSTDKKKYTGATVLPIVPGMYRDPVVCLDFASLYPSIIIAHHICPSTLVSDPQYLQLPQVEYNTISFSETVFQKLDPSSDQVEEEWIKFEPAAAQFIMEHPDVQTLCEHIQQTATQLSTLLGQLFEHRQTTCIDSGRLQRLVARMGVDLAPRMHTVYVVWIKATLNMKATDTEPAPAINTILARIRSAVHNLRELSAVYTFGDKIVASNYSDLIRKLERQSKDLNGRKSRALDEAKGFMGMQRSVFDQEEEEDGEVEESSDEMVLDPQDMETEVDLMTTLSRHHRAKTRMAKIDVRCHTNRKLPFSWRKTVVNRSYTFVTNQKDILPRLCTKFLRQRKAVRKQQSALAKSTDPEDQRRWRVLEGQQKGYKISANSVYGAVALMNWRLGAAITGQGRNMLQTVKTACEQELAHIFAESRWTAEDVAAKCWSANKQVAEFPSAVVDQPYFSRPLKLRVMGGDSVTGDTPILCRHILDGRHRILCISELGYGDYVDSVLEPGKEYQSSHYQVWTDKGFTTIRHVMRHRTAKKIFRICTTTGFVDATEDHSLLRPDGSSVCPNKVEVGDQLLHSPLPLDDPIRRTAMYPYPDFAAVGRHCGDIDNWDTDYCLYDINLVLNTDSIERAAFLAGFRETYIFQDTSTGVLRFDFFSKQLAAVLYYVLVAEGYSVILTDRQNPDKLQISLLAYPPSQLFENKNEGSREVTSIYEMKIDATQKKDQYVYDLITDNHHFAVGPGELVVHNTDSAFVEFVGCSLAEAISLGKKASPIISNKFPDAITIAYEKTWAPYIAVAMKKGAAKEYVDDPDPLSWKLQAKGLATKRRNYCPAVKALFKETIMTVMADINAGPSKAVALVDAHFEKLMKGEIPFDDLQMSTKLAGSYKSLNLPAPDLAARMLHREDFNTPQKGERFEFVYVAGDHKLKQYQKAEHLDYAKLNNLKPDICYYIEKQYKNPILGFLELTGMQDQIHRVFTNRLAQAQARDKGLSSITTMFTAKRALPIQSTPTDTITNKEDQGAQVTSKLREEKGKKRLKQSTLGWGKKVV